jgi:hypothetical protein
MGREEKDNNSHGSLKDLQILINEKYDILNNEVSKYFNEQMEINWVSPRNDDNYAEYSDNDFLKILGLNNKLSVGLNTFWPNGGPQWDALGKHNDKIFIVEAKANSGELNSNCGATSPESLRLIEKSLTETKQYLNVDKNIDWKKYFYQYANRISHLYYLRIKNNIDAYLVFIYFLNDKTVNGPSSIKEWHKIIKNVYETLSLKKENSLSKYIIDIFIDYNKII